MPASNLKQVVPFFKVTAIQKSIDFYVNGLGFELKLDWQPGGHIEWCLLEREGVAVMLQEYRQESRPTGGLGLGVIVCFICHDALSLYNEFFASGLSPSEPFVGNNMWVTNLKDPDGYELCFESATDVAEETTYSEWKRHQE